jgi:4-hydroxy-tetrahydrodipicolinate synthase
MRKGDTIVYKRRLSPQEVKPLLVGVGNIQFTPFKSATEIDEEALRAHTRFMIEGGIVEGRGMQTICGSNGEGFSMSDEEFKQVIDAVVDEAGGRVPIIVGCTRPATEPVIRLAQYAEEAGADCVMVLAPHYYPNEEPDVVYAHFKAVADATNIGIMIYNNANVTGQDLSVDLLERLAEIDNIVALKDTTANVPKLYETLYRLGDRFAIIPSITRYIMPLDYMRGSKGVITIFGNWDPAYALRMHDLAQSGDIKARQEMQIQAHDFLNFIYAGGAARLTSIGKEMCRIVGLSIGDYERLPLRRPSEEDRLKLRELAKKAGMAYGPSD